LFSDRSSQSSWIREYALREVARCAQDPNLRRGIKLHIANSKVDYHNAAHVAELRRVFAAANEHRKAIVVHMRTSISGKIPYGATEARISLDQIASAAPDVPIQIAHLAGAGGYQDPLIDQVLAFSRKRSRRVIRARRTCTSTSRLSCYRICGPSSCSRSPRESDNWAAPGFSTAPTLRLAGICLRKRVGPPFANFRSPSRSSGLSRRMFPHTCGDHHRHMKSAVIASLTRTLFRFASSRHDSVAARRFGGNGVDVSL
jgi:hypothetical protein